MTEPASAVTSGELALLARFLESDFGLRFTAANRDLIEAGMRAVAQELHLPMGALLHSLLCGDAALLHRLAGKATVRETYFFRHPEHFDALADHVVPALVHRGHTKLRAWSAGCATGEEAYSLAATLIAAAPSMEVSVLGTDLNESSLLVAAHGRYGRRSLRSDLPRRAVSGSLQLGPSGIEVAAALRARMRFYPLNLHQPYYPEDVVPNSGFDIIFCRNVLVYFAPEAATKVVLRLRDRLREGGYLFLAALDYTAAVPGLLPVNLGGVFALRRASPIAKAPPEPDRRPSTPPPRNIMTEAKVAADCGDHALATRLLHDALNVKRTPELLHLLALVRKECGHPGDTLALLSEATSLAPDYALGHLSLGLMALDPPLRDETRARRHLTQLLALLEHRDDGELVTGPEPIAVGLARMLASTALRQLAEVP